MHKLLVGSLFLVACGKSEQSRSEPKVEPKAEVREEPPPPPPKPEGPAIADECKLTSAKFEQTSKGGRNAVNVSYWYKEADRNKMMGLEGFAVHCQGSDMRFSIVPGAKTNKESAPFGPKKYTFVKGKSDISISAFVGALPWEPTTGTIDITAFDARHIAGTIDLKGKLDKNKPLDVKGSFDYKCQGTACER
ncbi:MAG: hypothetical protein WKG01_35335 [Kofleriaceae bacterium]